MEKYEMLSQMGDGTYGTVWKARHRMTGDLYAIKKMKQRYYTWEECVKLPEVVALRKLHTHPNIVKLKEVVREQNELYFVFEFMDGDMLGRIRHYKNMGATGVPHHLVKSYIFQI